MKELKKSVKMCVCPNCNNDYTDNFIEEVREEVNIISEKDLDFYEALEYLDYIEWHK